MPDLSRDLDDEDVLDAFANPYEPTTVAELAGEVGYAPQVVYKKLRELADRGLVESKRVNEMVRVWWRQPADATPHETGGQTAPHAEQDGQTAPHAEQDGQTAPHAEQDGQTAPHPETGGQTATEARAGTRGSAREGVPTRDLFQASPISIAVFDRAGGVSFANERAEQLLGLERAEQAGERYVRPEWNIYREDGSTISLAEHPISRVFETGEPSFGFEHWITLPDGTERWVWGNATPVVADERVEHVVVGFADVTALKEREEKLTSDRRRLLELSSAQLSGPFVDVADGPFQVTVDEVVSLSDGSALEYVTASGLSARALTGVLQQRDGVRNVRLLRTTGESCSFELRVVSRTLPVIFDEFGGTVLSLVERRPGESPTLSAELPGDVDPREAIQAARELYPDIQLDSQELRYSPRLLYDIVEEALTERKFAVLQMAYYGGYFETPRQSSGDELAEQLGITRQTFNQHLRKAEQLVFEQLFEASPQDKH